MSDAPERIWCLPGETDDLRLNPKDWARPCNDAIPYIRADLVDALIREAVEALEKTRDSMCEGFCGDLSSFDIYHPDMGLDCAVCSLRPHIAKLRAHLDGEKE